MLIGCKNCGSHFSEHEMRMRPPPLHSWPLTRVGERVLLENEATGGDPRPCPTCGQKTLR